MSNPFPPENEHALLTAYEVELMDQFVLDVDHEYDEAYRSAFDFVLTRRQLLKQFNVELNAKAMQATPKF